MKGSPKNAGKRTDSLLKWGEFYLLKVLDLHLTLCLSIDIQGGTFKKEKAGRKKNREDRNAYMI